MKTADPFLWGAATSSHQIEGYNEHNDWWHWEAQGHIDGGARSGAATDHRNRFREDIRLAAELGLNSYRFSVEWSRLEPEEGRWDSAAFEWYRELIAECEKYKILPMLTLHHFTSPQWFASQGGFTSDDSPGKFAEYVKRVAQSLGSRVPLWCTFNEPMVLITGTYLASFMPPARFSPANASAASYNMLRAHVLAYDILHKEIPLREGPWKDHPVLVGIAHNMMDFLPDRRWNLIEQLLTHVMRRYFNRSWLDAITGRKQSFGVLGLIPHPKQVAEARGRKTTDFIGMNYYTKGYVQWLARSERRLQTLPISLRFARHKERVSDLGWTIHPAGFAKLLKEVASYGLPIYITENGIADRDDRMRSEYLVLHLHEVAKAIATGIDVRGYYHWSLIDNFEWIKGFGPRFGLFNVNYDTFERTPTLSAQLYKKLIHAHRQEHDSPPSIEIVRK